MASLLCCKTATCLSKRQGEALDPTREQSSCCLPKPREPHGIENGSLEKGPALRSYRWESFSDCFPGISQRMQMLRGNTSVLWPSTLALTLGQSLYQAQAQEQNSFMTENLECGTDFLSIRWQVNGSEGGLCIGGKTRGDLEVNTRPALGGIWATASAVSVQGSSRVGPRVFLFSFFY